MIDTHPRLSPETAAAREARNAKIIKLHFQKIEHKIIAQRFGLTPSAVSYVVKKHLQAQTK